MSFARITAPWGICKLLGVSMYNARDERTAERRQRQSEGTDALWARGLLRKPRDQHRRSAQSHS